MQNHYKALSVDVKGLVQGVGFRPFVYRLAHSLELKGWVRNTNEGVVIKIEGLQDKLDQFVEKLQSNSPKASSIYKLESETVSVESFADFTIKESLTSSDDITQVCPDISVCDDCLRDMQQQPHRLNYPFINCTHCGPRFTIVRELPYDRKKTTMAPFEMCHICRSEYEDIDDRRFHAQPVACNRCGPQYTLHESDRLTGNIDDILTKTSEIIQRGGVIAIKGIGGYNLMCDAANQAAVRKMREIKRRSGKPFAVMVKNEDAAIRYADISPKEKELLSSWRRPVVLMNQHKPLAEDINPGFSSIGLMLPHMPFHYQMFEKFQTDAVVFTSGNISDEPIVIENQKALETFMHLTDAVITYNREIHNRADDSVVFAANQTQRTIRRAKGYVPEPVRLSFSADGILAVGAELNHCFALGKGDEVIISQHIGDLKDVETYSFFEESVYRFQKLFRVDPGHIICDLHPDYLSTQFAEQSNLPVTRVQHHHAHIAACMAEHHLDEPVIGICWDGTGLGTDNRIWGGEFLHATLEDFQRFSHFDYVPLPGGDQAVKEPWRTAASYLYKYFGDDLLDIDIPFIEKLKNKNQLDLILQALDRELNTPLSSAAGRLFDAVAAITEVCEYNTFHAEAPMKLEALIDKEITDVYTYEFSKSVSFAPMIKEIIVDIQNQVPVSAISAKFHNTLVSVIFEGAKRMNKALGTEKVILTGGVFQNKFLLEESEKRLADTFEVYSPHAIPANDAGIALGQIAISAKKLNLKSS